MGEINYNKAFALPYMIWVPVPVEGFEHLYDVSTLGQVRSHHTGKLLKPITINGYQYVNLHNKGKMKREYVHRLVAKAFLPQIDGKDIVNHLNENPLDCRVYNIEFTDTKGNINWGTANKRRGDKLSRPVMSINPITGEIKEYKSTIDAEQEGYNHSGISQCCNGHRRLHKGLIWQYK